MHFVNFSSLNCHVKKSNTIIVYLDFEIIVQVRELQFKYLKLLVQIVLSILLFLGVNFAFDLWHLHLWDCKCTTNFLCFVIHNNSLFILNYVNFDFAFLHLNLRYSQRFERQFFIFLVYFILFI